MLHQPFNNAYHEDAEFTFIAAEDAAAATFVDVMLGDNTVDNNYSLQEDNDGTTDPLNVMDGTSSVQRVSGRSRRRRSKFKSEEVEEKEEKFQVEETFYTAEFTTIPLNTNEPNNTEGINVDENDCVDSFYNEEFIIPLNDEEEDSEPPRAKFKRSRRPQRRRQRRSRVLQDEVWDTKRLELLLDPEYYGEEDDVQSPPKDTYFESLSRTSASFST